MSSTPEIQSNELYCRSIIVLEPVCNSNLAHISGNRNFEENSWGYLRFILKSSQSLTWSNRATCARLTEILSSSLNVLNSNFSINKRVNSCLDASRCRSQRDHEYSYDSHDGRTVSTESDSVFQTYAQYTEQRLD